MNILENLWYGNIAPSEQPLAKGSAYAAALKRVDTQIGKLLENNSPEIQSAVDSLLDRQTEAASIAEEKAFVTGFQLGVQMLLCALEKPAVFVD